MLSKLTTRIIYSLFSLESLKTEPKECNKCIFFVSEIKGAEAELNERGSVKLNYAYILILHNNSRFCSWCPTYLSSFLMNPHKCPFSPNLIQVTDALLHCCYLEHHHMIPENLQQKSSLILKSPNNKH